MLISEIFGLLSCKATFAMPVKLNYSPEGIVIVAEKGGKIFFLMTHISG